VYFQSRETVNPYYTATPSIVSQEMEKFARLTGRRYRLFDYVGASDAERIVVLMGSGCETAEETALELIRQGEKVGVLKVRLFRPFSAEAFLEALPKTTRAIAVLDRTKEPGALGEPLYQDVVTALAASWSSSGSNFGNFPKIIGGRYGIGSKEFTPGMVKAVFDQLKQSSPKNGFTIGIEDDVGFTSLPWDSSFSLERKDTVRATFWGLGADGTVSANKNSAKIIGEQTDNHVQAYFVYDSKKSGGLTVSHLRFGASAIRMPYLISRASFTAVHHFPFLEQFPVLDALEEGGVFLLNSPYNREELWQHLPERIRRQCVDKKLKVYAINANALATSLGLGRRINTIMQTCFFLVSGVMPPEEPQGRGYGAGTDVPARHSQTPGKWGSITPLGSRWFIPSAERPGFRPKSYVRAHTRRRRFPSGGRHASGRHLSLGHLPMGETRYRH
jgi:pyruvate-ferredoxin/flavodoxin oxidoreductase